MQKERLNNEEDIQNASISNGNASSLGFLVNFDHQVGLRKIIAPEPNKEVSLFLITKLMKNEKI